MKEKNISNVKNEMRERVDSGSERFIKNTLIYKLYMSN